MGSDKRVCKKCFLEKIDVGEEEAIEKYKAAIKEEDRVPEDEYERRLTLCSECDKLSVRTCAVCGCYVELRALSPNSKCPKHKW